MRNEDGLTFYDLSYLAWYNKHAGNDNHNDNHNPNDNKDENEEGDGK